MHLFIYCFLSKDSDQLTLDAKKYNNNSINTQRRFLSYFFRFGNSGGEHAKGRVTPCKGQSWILDSTPWIPDSRYWIPVFVSEIWILDSNL